MLRALHKTNIRSKHRDTQLDALFCFFQNCWHLKDWIKNDASLSEDVRAALNGEAHANDFLLLCKDLANGSKHLKLTTPSRKRGALWYVSAMSLGETNIREEFAILPGDEPDRVPMSAAYFAKTAAQSWRMILTKHKLLPLGSKS
jgi:hypothetical protein